MRGSVELVAVVLLSVGGVGGGVRAQVRASERGTVSQTIDGAEVTVNYSRPRVRGRLPLFGKVVRWGEIWTPGSALSHRAAGPSVNQLHYSERTGSGVLFHMIGALSEFGKIGLTAIANTVEEADVLFDRPVEVLDAETGYGRPPGEMAPPR